MTCADSGRRLLDNLSWAQGCARGYANRLPSYLDRDDLQSAGVLGYIKAAERFDAGKGGSFRGFCSVRIRGAVLDELRRWDWAPRSVNRSKKKLSEVGSALTAQLNREPTHSEIAAAMEIDLSELTTLQSQANKWQVVSFDKGSLSESGEDMLGLADRVADPNSLGADFLAIEKEDYQELFKCIEGLSSSQSVVINLHYLKELPLRDIAKYLNVTPSRVSQLHHQALTRLRTKINFRTD